MSLCLLGLCYQQLLCRHSVFFMPSAFDPSLEVEMAGLRFALVRRKRWIVTNQESCEECGADTKTAFME